MAKGIARSWILDNDDFVNRIIDEVNNNEVAFCKFLAVNETEEN